MVLKYIDKYIYNHVCEEIKKIKQLPIKKRVLSRKNRPAVLLLLYFSISSKWAQHW
jgi:hypothetical protein